MIYTIRGLIGFLFRVSKAALGESGQNNGSLRAVGQKIPACGSYHSRKFSVA
jgi:hypothetical protein